MIVPIEHTTEMQAGEAKDRYIYAFENAWGASVIRGPYSYGWDEGKWELCVMHGTGTEHEHLCYKSGITDDVIGWLTWEEVQDILDRISKLPFSHPRDCPDVDHLERAIKRLNEMAEEMAEKLGFGDLDDD